ncbi:putative membrane protein [Helicobacter pylori Hp P-4d]|nr:putative membrane protein [Helicobacter pylori Hp P-4d]EJC21496.1 putative membrane protein [Helicobacter pylori Hp P-4c]
MWVGSSISLLLGALFGVLLGVRSFIADWGGGGNFEWINLA